MEIDLKIRGIYSTALTKLFLDRGVTVVSPSDMIAKRFKGAKKFAFNRSVGTEITDLEDSQGILIKGQVEQLELIVQIIRETLFDAICRKTTNDLFVQVEFPYLAKSALDEFRDSVLPTVFNHHRLRIIASEYVDLIEVKELTSHPQKKEIVSQDLERRLIWANYKKGKEIGIEHVKLDGRVISLSEGRILEMAPKQNKLVLRRDKFKGRSKYDGLNVSKEEGDYAITDVREGIWYCQHTYFRQDGRLIGAYYNINTPVELYPDRIRYVDLEIDVVRWPDGNTKIIDEAELEKFCESGHLSTELQNKAKRTARELIDNFSGEMSTCGQ